MYLEQSNNAKFEPLTDARQAAEMLEVPLPEFVRDVLNPKTLPLKDELRRIDLWRRGLTDHEAASILGVTKKTYQEWRCDRGLESNRPPRGKGLSDEEHERRMALYERGLDDGEIAERVGLTARRSVGRWRERHDLPPNKGPGGKRLR